MTQQSVVDPGFVNNQLAVGDRIFLGANVHNARAIRAYEKAGFTTVGTMRMSGRDFRTGKYEDEVLMEWVDEERASRA